MGASEYYLPTGVPSTGSDGDSATIRNEFSAIKEGISEKLPDLSGNNNQIIGINGGATGLEAKSASDVKSQLSLENVDNTSDDDKPVSTAQATATALKEDSLSTPASDNMFLKSSAGGTRAWAFPGVGALPSGVMNTGNIYGLDCKQTGAHTIQVQSGSCFDSDNITLLTGALQTVTVPTVLNALYSVFICDDGTARLDTGADGSSLSGTYKIRWLDFINTDGSGDIVDRAISGNLISYAKASSLNLGAIGITYATIDHSSLIPEERVSEIMYGTPNTSAEDVWTSIDGGLNVEAFLGSGYQAGADTDPQAWGGISTNTDIALPFSIDRLFKCSGATGQTLSIHTIRIKR